MNMERCPGKYENVHGEFGQVIRRECIGCQRRMQPGAPMPVPEFAISCPKAVIYAKTLEKVALILFICNMVLLFRGYV